MRWIGTRLLALAVPLATLVSAPPAAAQAGPGARLAETPAPGAATQQAASQPIRAPASQASVAPPSQPSEPQDPEAPTVSARLEPHEGRVGDPFVLTVTAVHDRAVAVNIPTTLDLMPFLVLERLPETDSDLGNGRLKRDFRLKVAAYEPGDIRLPPVPVTYLTARGEARTVRTQPIDVRIASVLANENDPQLKPDPDPIPVRQRDLTALFVMGGVGLLAVGVVCGFLLRRWLRERRRRAAPPPPPRPAEDVAREHLDLLDRSDLLEREQFKEFYLRLSEIVRDYLGRRYGFPALDLTTTEILDELAKRKVPGPGLRPGPGLPGTAGTNAAQGPGVGATSPGRAAPDIGLWLFGTDLVKFAKHRPTKEDAREALAQAYAIVEVTTPVGLPPAPADGTSAETAAEEGRGP